MRLLLAEDEVELSNALVTILKHNNYSVDAVYNGLDALDYILAGNYDAVILDIMMPGLDGISVLKKTREEKNMVPIIMLTAKSEIDDKVEGLDAGANDYLTKPFSSKELLARLRVLTRNGAVNENAADNILKFQDITLNRATYTLEGPDGEVKLPTKEYQMLEMLMMNPRQVISADQFMEKIWGFDSDAEQNVVWVYLSYLRKKLTGVNGHVQIKAARGLGYSLEEAKE